MQPCTSPRLRRSARARPGRAPSLILAALCLPLMAGCGQQWLDGLRGSEDQWRHARATLRVAEGCIDAINTAVPGAREELEVVRASLRAGHEAVDLWEATGEEPLIWQKIAGEVAHLLIAVSGAVKEAGVLLPDELDQALTMLGLLTGYEK